MQRRPATAPALLFGAEKIGRGGRIEAEDAEFAGRRADLVERLGEVGGIRGFDIEEELVLPRAAVEGTAFDFEQIDAVTCEAFAVSSE